MSKKVGANECDPAFDLYLHYSNETFFTSSVLFLTIFFLLLKFVEQGYSD